MPTPDDDQFEAYLKQFRPVAPEALPAIAPVRKPRRVWRLSALIATAAAIIVLAIVVMRVHREQIVRNAPERSEGSTYIAAKPPLTMRNASKLLAEAPTFKSAVNDLAFKSQKITFAKNEISAVHVLGKEKIKL
jgi:hypothetical protein